MKHHKEYIKYRQKQLEEKAQRAAEVEYEEEEARVAKLEEIDAREKLLLAQQEKERLHQNNIQRKEKLAEQKWDKHLDTLVAQIKDRFQKDDKLEEIRVIIQNREPALQELDWASWLSDPLNQKLADLDFERAMEMFKRDNLMATRQSSKPRKKKNKNYSLSFTGNSVAATRTYDHVTTDFNPDDYDLNLGFTVSYWLRPDEVGNTMFAFGRKHSNNERFTFGINRKRQVYIGIGSNTLTKSWVNMDTPVEESLLEEDGSYWNLKTDGTWYHFVVTYDDRSDASSGTDRKLYVNGVLRQTDSINWSSTGGSFTDDGMMFGGRNLRTSNASKYNNGWACGLDEVAIFDTAKDSGWVTNTYNSATRADLRGQSGLVGYWRFNQGIGTTVIDYSGNGNHGTFAPIGTNPGGIVTTAYPTWEYRGKLNR